MASLLQALGTLAHNRPFSARDVTEYVGINGANAVRRLVRKGLVTRVPGGYFPTPKGWEAIEQACYGDGEQQ
jgi:DNA-binding MarR family transcriptional regulator